MRSPGSAVLLASVAACLSCGEKSEICHGEGCNTSDDSSMEIVYDDALAPHWQTLSAWNSGQTEEETITNSAGKATMAVHATASGDFAGFWFARTDAPLWQGNRYWASVADYSALRAWILFADTAAIPDILVALGDGTSGVGSDVPVTSYLPTSPEANHWYEVVVPMDAFQATSGQTFICVGLGFGAHSVDLYVDDVRLELAAGGSALRAMDVTANGAD